MTQQQRTMAVLSYGFGRPQDLFEKLKRDATKLSAQSHADDVFNFLVTAASLQEWVGKNFKDVPLTSGISAAVKSRDWKSFPSRGSPWLADASCVPNTHLDERHHIVNALRICWEAAGASKHFYWESKIKDVQWKPIVGNWYQYVFTSVEPDLYVDYDGESYGLAQIKGIVLQFYETLFDIIEGHRRFADE